MPDSLGINRTHKTRDCGNRWENNLWKWKDKHKAYHVVSAFVSENQLTLGEITVEEKTNEITAVPELLNLIDVKGPIIGTIGVIVGVVLGALNFMFSSSKNSENQKNEVRAQINNNVFPQVRSQVYPQIETTIKEKAAEIKSRVDEKVNTRRSTLMKALEDTRAKLTADKQEKEKAVEKAQNYRNEIEEIKNELL